MNNTGLMFKKSMTDMFEKMYGWSTNNIIVDQGHFKIQKHEIRFKDLNNKTHIFYDEFSLVPKHTLKGIIKSFYRKIQYKNCESPMEYWCDDIYGFYYYFKEKTKTVVQ